jgi:hypothetical protein
VLYASTSRRRSSVPGAANATRAECRSCSVLLSITVLSYNHVQLRIEFRTALRMNSSQEKWGLCAHTQSLPAHLPVISARPSKRAATRSSLRSPLNRYQARGSRTETASLFFATLSNGLLPFSYRIASLLLKGSATVRETDYSYLSSTSHRQSYL